MTKINRNFAIYWNNEYIGEAERFDIIKGTDKEMPIVQIRGHLQIVRKS